MRVLQTLGERKDEGIFQYRRCVSGVEIDASIGRAPSLNKATVTLTHAEWEAILVALSKAKRKTFRLTETIKNEPPKQSLRDTIKGAVPSPSDGWSWNDSWAAYVAAILEHEGSVDLYGGAVGGGSAVSIVLARDV